MSAARLIHPNERNMSRARWVSDLSGLDLAEPAMQHPAVHAQVALDRRIARLVQRIEGELEGVERFVVSTCALEDSGALAQRDQPIVPIKQVDRPIDELQRSIELAVVCERRRQRHRRQTFEPSVAELDCQVERGLVVRACLGCPPQFTTRVAERSQQLAALARGGRRQSIVDLRDHTGWIGERIGKECGNRNAHTNTLSG